MESGELSKRIAEMANHRPEVLAKLRGYMDIAFPNVSKQSVFSDDELRTIDKVRKLYEQGDPIRFAYEIFGYPSTPDIERGVDLLLNGKGKYFAIGCHDSGKTQFIGAGIVFGWCWFAYGSMPDLDGDYTGGYLSLVANTEQQILKTSYRSLNDAARDALKRGWHIPNYKNKSHWSDVAVRWRIVPNHWQISKETYQKPAKDSRSQVVHQVSGLKSRNLTVWIEEAHLQPPQIFTTIEGMNPRIVFGALNPYDMGGSARNLVDMGEYESSRYSVIRHPSVVNRGGFPVEGVPDHRKFESKLRNPLLVTNLGLSGKYTDERKDLDFDYALPDDDVEDEPGPRNDGVPGHPKAEVSLFRPIDNTFIPASLGEDPIELESQVFSEIMWRNSLELWSKLAKPSRPPDVIGVDMAFGGPDRIIEFPRWGQSCFEFWKRFQTNIDSGLSFDDSINKALVCGKCNGHGCDFCFDGRDYIYFWKSNSVAKDKDPVGQSIKLRARYGNSPKRNLDEAGGGYSIESPMRKQGATNTHTIQFGSNAPDVPAARAYLNQRAFMYGIIALAMRCNVVAINASREVKAACRLLEWEVSERATKKGKNAYYKLQPKEEIKKLLSGLSPDESDALALTEAFPHLEYSARFR